MTPLTTRLEELMAIQLDFFMTKEECEMEWMREQIRLMKESNDKVRKKLFARQGDLIKGVIDLNERMTIIERNICRGC